MSAQDLVRALASTPEPCVMKTASWIAQMLPLPEALACVSLHR